MHTTHSSTVDELCSSILASPVTDDGHESNCTIIPHHRNSQDISKKESLERIEPAALPYRPSDYSTIVEEKLRKLTTDETTSVYSQDSDFFPDGGAGAWIVVFGLTCGTFSTFGFLNCWGIFQAYYQESLLKDYSPSAIAWIGSIQYSLVFFPGLVVGRLFDLGYFRPILLSASILLLVATVLVGECTKYWHFILCQGIAVGISCGCLFGCCNAAVAHWFKKKRGRALGYGAIGSGVSGTVVPIVAKKMIPLVGFSWTMRILGFILLIALGACNLSVRTRLLPRKVEGGSFNFSVFKNAAFTAYCVATLILYLGLYTFPSFVSVSAAQLGHNPKLAYYFVTIANGSSLFGRWSAGILGDAIGPMNAMIPYMFLIGVVTFIWPFTHSTPSLIAIAIIYGFCIGSYVSLSLNPVMNMGGEGDVGRRIGMFLTVMALGVLAGPPISGRINSQTDGFEVVAAYAGGAVILASCCMILVRYLLVRGGTTGKM